MVRLGNQWLAEGRWRADTYVTEQPYVAVGSDGVHRLEWERPMNARVARCRFYEGFVLAVGLRFLEARQAAESEAERADLTRVVDSSGKELSVTTLALRDKRQQVDEFTAREFERQGGAPDGVPGRRPTGVTRRRRPASRPERRPISPDADSWCEERHGS